MDTEQIRQRILETFSDAQVLVLDMTGAGSNFEVRISSTQINELPRIKRHQSILQLFTEEFQSGEIHAMSVKPIDLEN